MNKIWWASLLLALFLIWALVPLPIFAQSAGVKGEVTQLNSRQQLERDLPYPGCPRLPVEGVTNKISVYVVKAQVYSGLVCVRVINGLDEPIYSGVIPGRLQQWEKRWWWREGQFRDFQDVSTLPDGSVVFEPAALFSLPAGAPRDGFLPLSGHPAPPGRYRVCFRYQIERQGARSEHEVCSEEFLLP
jgi:hypothetical protein